MKAIKFMLSACVAAVALTSCEKEEFVPQVQDTRMKSVEISLENVKFNGTRGAAGNKIKQGDTLGGIAARYGVSVRQIRNLNGIKGNNIRAGKTIRVR